MKCPYCLKKAKVNSVVYTNLENYGRSVKARSECCGKIINVSIEYSFLATETKQEEVDDWGR